MAKAEAAEESALPFEAALARLEEVVDRLEQGDLELEASLAAFEKAMQLSVGSPQVVAPETACAYGSRTHCFGLYMLRMPTGGFPFRRYR